MLQPHDQEDCSLIDPEAAGPVSIQSPIHMGAVQAAVRGRRHRRGFIAARAAAVRVQAAWRGSRQRSHTRRQQVRRPNSLCRSQPVARCLFRTVDAL
jgi:hypothetical protein